MTSYCEAIRARDVALALYKSREDEITRLAGRAYVQGLLDLSIVEVVYRDDFRDALYKVHCDGVDFYFGRAAMNAKSHVDAPVFLMNESTDELVNVGTIPARESIDEGLRAIKLHETLGLQLAVLDKALSTSSGGNLSESSES